MSFDDFVREADQRIDFYATTPPHHYLEHGSVFSGDLTVARLLTALFRDLEVLVRKHGLEAPAGELNSDELVNYAMTVEDKFKKTYYSDDEEDV